MSALPSHVHRRPDRRAGARHRTDRRGRTRLGRGRRPVLPAGRQRRVRRAALRPRPALRPGDRAACGAGPGSTRWPPRTVAVPPRPGRPHRAQHHRAGGTARPGPAAATSCGSPRPHRWPTARSSPSWSPTTASPQPFNEPSIGQMGFFRDRRRLRHRGPAARRGDVLPGQRPPDRQGVVHLPGHRARTTARSSPTAGSSARAPPAAGRRGPGTRPTRWPATSPPSTSATGTPRQYQVGRIRYHNAIDPDLFDGRFEPPTAALRGLAGRRQLLQAAHPPDRRARGRRHGRLHRRPGHRAGLGLRVRRGAHRRPGRLDDARGPERPHLPGHRGTPA